MYESIRIQNFRGLRDLTIENLGRVNLLVGANNVGKTSVLEAIWLLNLYGNPNLGTATATFRGAEGQLNPVDVWRGLIRGGDATGPETVISARDQATGGSSLTIHFDVGATSGVSAAMPANSAFAADRPNEFGALTFTHADHSIAGGTIVARISLSNLGFAQDLTPSDGRRAMFISPVQWMSPRDLAVAFTLADDFGYLDVVLRALRAVEPRLERLSLGLSANDDAPMIRAHLEGERIPVPIYLVGTGTNRLAQILLGLVLYRGGVALIDEIDMGVYYDALEAHWRSIAMALDETRTQLFTTTHSLECIEATMRAFEGPAESNLRVIRLQRAGDDVEAVDIEYDQVKSLFEFALEFR